jgi:hypothetical protein
MWLDDVRYVYAAESIETNVICWTENWIERVNRMSGRSDLFQ